MMESKQIQLIASGRKSLERKVNFMGARLQSKYFKRINTAPVSTVEREARDIKAKGSRDGAAVNVLR
jgi:hypothetical protein